MNEPILPELLYICTGLAGCLKTGAKPARGEPAFMNANEFPAVGFGVD